MTVAPKLVFRSRVAIAGNGMRYDHLEEDGSVIRSFAFDGARWTQFDSKRQVAAIRRTDQLPAMFPLDPREAVAYDVRYPLVSMLQRSVIGPQEAEGASASGFRAEYSEPNGNRFVVEFDPDYALLPVESFLYRGDGTMYRHTRLWYQKIPSRDAWVLEKAVSNFYAAENTAQHEETQPSEVNTTYVEDVQLLEESESDAVIALSIPATARVHDHLSGESGNRQPKAEPHSRGPVLSTLLWINGFALVAGLLWFLQKRKGVDSLAK